VAEPRQVKTDERHPVISHLEDQYFYEVTSGTYCLNLLALHPEKGTPMSYRTIISLAAAGILGTALVSSDALAYRAAGFRVGGVRAGGVRVGGVYRGAAYVRPRVGVGVGAAAVGAAAVGAAVAAPYYRPACGYYPYQPCY
jgi:hypothetical protein